MCRTVVALVLLVCIFCQLEAYDEQLYSCTAWGDPHVTRFSLNGNDYPQEVWCQESGFITLLKNKYVHASVWVSENPYVITEFNFVFFNDAGIPICVVNGNQFLSPAAQCGQDIIITKNGNFITIDYRKFDTIVYLRKIDWRYQNWTYFYSIWIWQSSCLIKMSDGLCKTSCDPNTGTTLGRRRRALPSNGFQESAANICQTFISKLAIELNNSLSQQMTIYTQNAYNACLTDVRNTGDLTFGKASVEVLAVNSVTNNISSAVDLQQILNQTITLINRTNTQIDTQILQLINSTASPSINYTVVYWENQAVSISCVQSLAGVIKIVSASYTSRSSSCSMDATPRVEELCANSTGLCEFVASNIVLQRDPCYDEYKQLTVVFQCQ